MDLFLPENKYAKLEAWFPLLSFTLKGSKDTTTQAQTQTQTQTGAVPSLSTSCQALVESWLQDKPFASSRSLSKPNEEELHFAIALLVLFVQLNWTGPFPSSPPSRTEGKNPEPEALSLLLQYLHIEQETRSSSASSSSSSSSFHRTCMDKLAMDGELPYSLCKAPWLLSLSLYLFSGMDHAYQTDIRVQWWAMRALFLHQKLFENASTTLKTAILVHMDQVGKSIENESPLLQTLFSLEKALVYLYYHLDNEGQEALEKSQRLHGFEWSLSGALGKRTKFQTFDVAQLVVISKNTQRKKSNDLHSTPALPSSPQSVELKDDVLLDSKSFSAPSAASHEPPCLDPLENCLLLAHSCVYRKSIPDHTIRDEQVMALLEKVLEKSSNWSVHTLGLYYRSQIELKVARKAERALLQLQAMVDQMEVKGEADWQTRLAYFWQLSLPPRWTVEVALGQAYMKMGSFTTARNLFARLEMWDQVIVCYVAANKEKEAEALIRKQLEERPHEPKLYCLLGDLTNDPSLYEKSWTVSGHRYAASQRSLGYYHFFRTKDYEKAIHAYQLSLTLNPLNENAWFALGCAAMKLQKWPLALEALLRVVNLNFEHAEAWNNIATIHMVRGDLSESVRALEQCLKLSYEDWKIWDNYLRLNIQLGRHMEILLAAKRIFELTNAIDLKVLHMITDFVVEAEPMSEFEVSKLKELYDSIQEKYTGQAEYWTLYALLESKLSAPRELECRMKAYQCFAAKPYDTDYALFESFLPTLLRLVETLLKVQEQEKAMQILSDTLRRTRKEFEGTRVYLELATRLDILQQA